MYIYVYIYTYTIVEYDNPIHNSTQFIITECT